MRKLRDIDAEMKALTERQRQLKARKVVQLGELVIATGADVLDPSALAGALLHAAEQHGSDLATVAAWRQRGDAFFRGERTQRTSAASAHRKPLPTAAAGDGAEAR